LSRNYLLKHVTERRQEGMRRRGRRYKQLLDEFKGKRRYPNLKEQALELALEEAMDLSQNRLRNEYIPEESVFPSSITKQQVKKEIDFLFAHPLYKVDAYKTSTCKQNT
jgi:hypothetical protein